MHFKIFKLSQRNYERKWLKSSLWLCHQGKTICSLTSSEIVFVITPYLGMIDISSLFTYYPKWASQIYHLQLSLYFLGFTSYPPVTYTVVSWRYLLGLYTSAAAASHHMGPLSIFHPVRLTNCAHFLLFCVQLMLQNCAHRKLLFYYC